MLSLGAVYSLLACIYHWSSIITNYFYNELFGKVHFISFFISSNPISMPMHFTGIAGHPRRIPDYINIYYKLHYIESIGGLGIIIS